MRDSRLRAGADRRAMAIRWAIAMSLSSTCPGSKGGTRQSEHRAVPVRPWRASRSTPRRSRVPPACRAVAARGCPAMALPGLRQVGSNSPRPYSQTNQGSSGIRRIGLELADRIRRQCQPDSGSVARDRPAPAAWHWRAADVQKSCALQSGDGVLSLSPSKFRFRLNALPGWLPPDICRRGQQLGPLCTPARCSRQRSRSGSIPAQAGQAASVDAILEWPRSLPVFPAASG